MGSLLRLRLLANHFPPLHGLRVVAILWVIQVHLAFELGARGILPTHHWVYVLSQKFWFAMDLFFILSGFLIGTLLLVASSDPSTSALRGIGRFYARRSFRIFPLYYFVLTALAFGVYRHVPGLINHDPLRQVNLIREYLYLTNYTDTLHVTMFWGWSMCVEEHFYLAVPLLFLALQRLPSLRARLWLLGVLWISALAVRMTIPFLHPSPMDGHTYFLKIYIPTHTRYDTLLAGIILAHVQSAWAPDLRTLLEYPSMKRATRAFIALAFAGMMFPPPFVHAGLWHIISIGTLSSLAWGAAILYLLNTDGKLSRWLSSPAFLPLATLGYGVYLIHIPFVVTFGLVSYVLLARSHTPPALGLLAGTAVVFGLCLLVAYVLHLVIEKPALAARDRFTP